MPLPAFLRNIAIEAAHAAGEEAVRQLRKVRDRIRTPEKIAVEARCGHCSAAVDTSSPDCQKCGKPWARSGA